MQLLAREMNLSETVFVLPPERGGHARIRIFTPTRELPFAGHPTLGAAFVLGGPLQRSDLRLETGAGTIPSAWSAKVPRIVFGWMTQPLPKVAPFDPSAPLFAALGVEGSRCRSRSTTSDRTTCSSRSTRRRAVAARDARLRGARAARRTPASTCLQARARATRRACSRHAMACPRTPPPDRQPVRSHCTSRATGALASATRSRSSKAPRSVAPRALYARVDGKQGAVERVQVGGAAVVIGRGEVRVPQEPDAGVKPARERAQAKRDAARTSSTIAGAHFAGEPASNGGCGSYSMPS